MAWLSLIWRSSFRNRLRTTLTAVGVAVTIIAFLFLRTFIAAWYLGVEGSAGDRLVVRNRISITSDLPRHYVEKVRATPGVTDASWANWFGGVYIDERNFFAQFAVDPESYYRLYPEFVLDDDAKKAFFADRAGAVAGDLLAAKFGWKVGDKITLRGTIYPGTYEFTLRGIYHGRDRTTDRQQFHMQWAYVDDKVPDFMKNKVGIVLAKVSSPDAGKAIDAKFLNSDTETRSESEKQFQLNFVSMSGAILYAIQGISIAVILILILILANTMAMGSRERTGEYAAMRAIGFRPAHIVWLVVGEGFIIAAYGAALGLALASPILSFFARVMEESMGAFLGAFEFDVKAAIMATGIALACGMVAASWPAYRAGRLRIVDALRRIE